MIFVFGISGLASASAWMPLLYESTIFGLTLNRTLPEIRNKSQSYVIKRLFKDGLLYYSIIFAVNAVLTSMIISTPVWTEKHYRAVRLSNSSRLTVTMMSRITLTLKESFSKELQKCNLGVSTMSGFAAAARQTFASTLLFGRQSSRKGSNPPFKTSLNLPPTRTTSIPPLTTPTLTPTNLDYLSPAPLLVSRLFFIAISKRIVPREKDQWRQSSHLYTPLSSLTKLILCPRYDTQRDRQTSFRSSKIPTSFPSPYTLQAFHFIAYLPYLT
ncbi:hypothetical protein C8J56DRAFT_1101143 [Mycena floridula]|nr:hypothetical protein C8J56DRAFT_1101143 [Mycena floridula]